jgi:phosphohistidine phosphatase SixA
MIAAKALRLKKKLRVLKSLAPDGDPKMLVRHLALNFRTRESVMLVGHEPFLGRLIGVLIGGLAPKGIDASPSIPIELSKGGLAKLSGDSLCYDKCATLEWLLTPRILKKLI